MYNLLISLGALAVSWILVSLILGGVFYGIIPGLIAFGVAYVWLARRSYMAMGAAVQASQELLQPPPGFNPMNPAQAGKWKPPFEKAIAVLEAALALQKWQFLIAEQLAGQIGQLYYLQKNYDAAVPYLQQAWARDWMAKAFLGAHMCRLKKLSEMKSAFEIAVKAHDKEPFLWNVYAWCLQKLGEDATAILVLDRAHTLVPGDERTATNLQNVRNGKKVTMKPFGDTWYLFFLEDPPQVMVPQGYGAQPFGQQRGMRQPPRKR
jgi:tetratricopeptide (TPR) repeat protein